MTPHIRPRRWCTTHEHCRAATTLTARITRALTKARP